MRIAMLSPIAWRTPPRHYGPWEWVVSQLTEGLVRRGVDVTLFATADSQTSAKLEAVCPRGYEEDRSIEPKVWEGLHIANVFEQAHRFDLIHNHFDFLPLTYSGLVQTPVLTTIHGFSSEKILPVYQKYNRRTYYVAISEADRRPELDYLATIHHGIPVEQYQFHPEAGEYLLVFGRIHHDKGVHEAIQLAQSAGMPLIIAGIIQDEEYFREKVEPFLDDRQIRYIGSVGPAGKSEVLGKALALLHLINFDEPFGLSVVESMACGTPVIAINRGAMPEVVVDGETGFLVHTVEEAQAALRRIPDIDRRRCRAHVEAHFTVERMVDQYLEVYQKILNRG
ncbi:MAG: glycosyltransferase family 4 protein [Calditrichaeota bacterium]|nr:MAG: glycosyltransferase family 4 protein [Calditrichota bacterium]